MKKLSSLLSFLLIFSAASVAQMPEKSTAKANNNNTPKLVFLFERGQLFYNSLRDKEKIKVDSIEKSHINKILDSELAFLKTNKNNLSVAIDGDTIMSDPNFKILLETLLDKKFKRVHILTSL